MIQTAARVLSQDCNLSTRQHSPPCGSAPANPNAFRKFNPWPGVSWPAGASRDACSNCCRSQAAPAVRCRGAGKGENAGTKTRPAPGSGAGPARVPGCVQEVYERCSRDAHEPASGAPLEHLSYTSCTQRCAPKGGPGLKPANLRMGRVEPRRAGGTHCPTPQAPRSLPAPARAGPGPGPGEQRCP